jgi:hypothetical protein
MVFLINYIIGWPKIFESENDEDYCDQVILKFDKTKKKSLNFVEFCEYMEALWSAYDKEYINVFCYLINYYRK